MKPDNFFKKNKISAIRLKHGIDPIKQNGVRLSKFENAGCIMLNQDLNPDEKFKELFQGKKLYISAGPKIKLDDGIVKSSIVFEQEGRKFEYLSSELSNFIFGGFSSRFWMLKSYISMMPNENELPPSMLCWNMISLKLKTKWVDLIVED